MEGLKVLIKWIEWDQLETKNKSKVFNNKEEEK